MRPFLLAVALCTPLAAAEPKPVPRMQAIPLPREEVSFQRDGEEIARFRFAQDQRRPFVFPIIGPSGRSLTRMGHPRDPVSHSHHNSVWFSHQSVGGTDFWGDNGGRIAHLRLTRLEDSDEVALAETENAWLDKENKPVLHDRRRVSVKPLAGKEWLLLLDLQLEARTADVTLGESAFGMLGVRMAKTIGVHDGGGTIRNSEGGVDEAGCFRKPARWMDYSGPIAKAESGDRKAESGASGAVIEGIALFDHPRNPNHPVPFHCRNDGWMGASLTFPGALTVKKGEPMRLRYALYIHSGMPERAKIEEQWKAFAATEWEEFPGKKK
jgi:Methane oxygenase PmoA